MSRRTVHVGIYLILIALTLGTWKITQEKCEEVKGLGNQVEWRALNEPLKQEHLHLLEEGEEHFVAWHEKEGQSFYNPRLFRYTQGNCLYAYGDTDLLIDCSAIRQIRSEEIESEEIKGEGSGREDIRSKGYVEGVKQEDAHQALISTAMAYSLWGTEQALGETFEQEGKTYFVQGLFEEEACMAILKEEDTDPLQTYSALRINLKGMTEGAQQMETLGFKYHLPEGRWINLNLKSSLVSQIGLLPAWLIGIYAVGMFYKGVRGQQISPEQKGYLLVGGVAFVVGVLGVMQFMPQIPTEWIPNQWSDFDFWVRLKESFVDTGRSLKGLPSYWADQRQEALIREGLVGCGSTLLGFFVSVQYYKKYFMKKSYTDGL